MTNKKLPAGLQKLLNEQKQAWTVDENELAKRINNAKVNYLKQLPTIGNDTDFAQIVLYEQSFQRILEQLHQSKWADYTIDYNRSSSMSSNYKVFLNKPQKQQDADLERIEKQVKQKYLSELDAVKQEYIENLLFEHSQQEAEAQMEKEKEQQAKLRQQLLSMLD